MKTWQKFLYFFEKPCKKESLPLLPIFLAVLFVWIISCNQLCLDIITHHRKGYAVMLTTLYATFSFYLVVIKGEKDYAVLLKLLFFAGIILRAYYVFVAPYNITKHDTGWFAGFDVDEIAHGHFGYIEYIFKNKKLPDFDSRERGSFYNPPGFHIATALLLSVTRLFKVEVPYCYESLQVVTFLFSNLTVWTSYHILKEFNPAKKTLILLTAMLSFSPLLFYYGSYFEQ